VPILGSKSQRFKSPNVKSNHPPQENDAYPTYIFPYWCQIARRPASSGASDGFGVDCKLGQTNACLVYCRDLAIGRHRRLCLWLLFHTWLSKLYSSC